MPLRCLFRWQFLPLSADNRFDNRLYRVYSRLSNRLYNSVWQPVERTAAVRSTRLSSRSYNRLYCYTTSLTTGLTTGWMFVYTIQPVDNPVVQPVRQPVVSCKRGITVTTLCLNGVRYKHVQSSTHFILSLSSGASSEYGKIVQRREYFISRPPTATAAPEARQARACFCIFAPKVKCLFV